MGFERFSYGSEGFMVFFREVLKIIRFFCWFKFDEKGKFNNER